MKIWNQGAFPKYRFGRNTCPICGKEIPEDDGYGSMEISEKCVQEDPYECHYSRFMSIFSNSITIMGKSFEPNDVEDIEKWLDEVGNKDFMVEVTEEEYNKKLPRQLSEMTERVTMDDVRPEVKWMAIEMEKTLRKNDHKGGWQDCSIEYLYAGFFHESVELDDEIYGMGTDRMDYDRIIAEAVDAANYAMMIADVARKLKQDKEREESGK
jgi:hypothetical protein